MSRYELGEFYQLMDAKTELNNRKVSTLTCDIGANAIQSVLNIMIMINGEDDNRTFTTREIFDALYKDMR